MRGAAKEAKPTTAKKRKESAVINNKLFTFILALVAFTFTLTGCYEPPVIQVNVPVPEVTVIVDGTNVAPEDTGGGSVSGPTLEISYLGPDPGTSIEPGGCGTLMEIEVSVNGTLSFNRHGFVLLANGVAPGAIFSSTTFLVDGVIQEDLVDLLPNIGAESYVFEENAFALTNETAVFTYSGCVHPEATIDSPAANIQAVIDYNAWDVTYANGTFSVEFDEAFQYAHRVGVQGIVPEPCAAKLILSDLGSGQVYCQGSLTTGSQFEDGMLVQHDQLNVLYYTHSGSRYYMPHGAVMESWYGTACSICNDVVQAGAELTNLALMGTVTAKPGSVIVTLPNDSQLWVVDSCRTLRSVTPLMAQSIYGVNWNDLVRIIPEVSFVDYTIGFPVLNGADYNPPTSVSIMDEMICTP